MRQTDREHMYGLDVTSQQRLLDEMVEAATFCTRFVETATRHAHLPAQYWQADGEWQSRTWGELLELVRQATVGIHSLGVTRGARCLIVGGNVPEHVITDLALLHAGLVPISLYATMSDEQIDYVLRHSEAEIAVVAGEAALARMQAIAAAASRPLRIVMWTGSAPGAHAWADLLAIGRDWPEPDAFESLYRQVQPSDMIQMVYTSGTTGPPKAVELTHYMLIWLLTSYSYVFDFQPGERLLSYLPLAHLAERFHVYYPALLSGATTYFWPEFDTMVDGLRVARPAYIMGTPRVFEKLMSRLQGQIDADPVLAHNAAIVIEAENARQRGDRVEDLDAEAAARTVVRPLLQDVGLADCRGAIVSGAPPGEDLFPFFRGLGFPLGALYGQTEMGGGVTASIEDYLIGTAGRRMPGIELEIAPDTEILLRAPCVTPGYYRDAEATAKLLGEDGWLRSGDLGALKDDVLSIVGRKKEIIITSGGKNVTPALVEGAVKEIGLVDQVCVVGDGRNYLTAVITLNQAALRSWAARAGKGEQLDSLSADPVLEQELADAVAQVNTRFNRVEQVKRFYVAPGEWTVESGHFTPSLKLRRSFVNAVYEDQIEAMYRGEAGIGVSAAARPAAAP